MLLFELLPPDKEVPLGVPPVMVPPLVVLPEVVPPVFEPEGPEAGATLGAGTVGKTGERVGATRGACSRRRPPVDVGLLARPPRTFATATVICAINKAVSASSACKYCAAGISIQMQYRSIVYLQGKGHRHASKYTRQEAEASSTCN